MHSLIAADAGDCRCSGAGMEIVLIRNSVVSAFLQDGIAVFCNDFRLLLSAVKDKCRLFQLRFKFLPAVRQNREHTLQAAGEIAFGNHRDTQSIIAGLNGGIIPDHPVGRRHIQSA